MLITTQSTSSSIGCIPDISLDLTLVAHVFGGEPEYASGLVLAKANALGGRILAFGFRRAINNHVIGPYGGITIAPRAYAPAVTWTFENISCERPRPHFLVNDFCENWDAKHDNNDDVEALTQVPRTFIMRAMKRCPLAGESEGDGCFLEHATVAERQSCKHTHPECTAGHDGYGYVGELDD
jgi:hypothetical protein